MTSFGARDVDVTIPNTARMYDLWLGGSHNFEVDRRLAEDMARHNRSFLRRAVLFCLDQGIRQFWILLPVFPPWATFTKSPRVLSLMSVWCM